MTNFLCLTIYAPLFSISLILLFDTARKDLRDYAVRQYLLFCVSLVGWLVCEMLCCFLRDPFWHRYVFGLKLAFAAFIAVTVFLALSGFYRVHKLYPKWLPAALCVIPVLTALLALLSPFHSLLLGDFAFLQTDSVPLTVGQLGPWYYVHTFYSQGLAVAIALLLVFRSQTLPRAYRSGSLFLFLGMGSYLLCTALGSFGLERHFLDFNLIGVCIGGVFYHLASLVNARPNYLHIERREVYHYLDEAVFILNEKGRVVDINATARILAQNLGLSCINQDAGQLLRQLEKEEKLVRKKARNPREKDLFLILCPFHLVFEIQTEAVTQSETGEKGQFCVLTDVTNDHLSMERLRDLAGVDELTGLSNRYRFRQILQELDDPAALPTSIVVGDINGLKAINDCYGHETGDRVIQLMADALRRSSPEDSHVARIGGDEFAILLPRCGPEEAQALIHRVQNRLHAHTLDDGLTLSIALGAVTRHTMEESLPSLLHQADLRMYREKRVHLPSR